jgi:low affinity Fe/Cu permease
MSKFGMNLCLVLALAIIMLPLSVLAQNVAAINARIDSLGWSKTAASNKSSSMISKTKRRAT